MMQSAHYIDTLSEARLLLKPLRLELLQALAQPSTCNELADRFGESPQNIYYHVKRLEKAGLVDKIEEQRVRGVMQGIYQAAARSYWLSPRLAGDLGGRGQARDQMSLGTLLHLAEEIHNDVGSLLDSEPNSPSLGISGRVQLQSPEQRMAFLEELETALQTIASKYGAGEAEPGEGYRLVVACYPKLEPQ
jgi:DNA-binding transcriptional ArsR family regulator